MNENKKTNIVLFAYQFSVVVKGIEQKLTELGYPVTSAKPDLNIVMQNLGNTTVFIVYLSKEILEKKSEISNLVDLADQLREQEQKVIVIGEKVYFDDYIREVPLLRQFIWLNLPINMEVISRTIKALVPEQEQTVAKRKILIIDSDPFYTKIIQEWLKDTYEVRAETVGMKAIAYLTKNKVDMILLNYEMPTVDGPNLYKMIKSSSSTSHIPVVFLTGLGTIERIEQVSALKPAGYILKSTTREGMLDYLKGLFEKQDMNLMYY